MTQARKLRVLARWRRNLGSSPSASKPLGRVPQGFPQRGTSAVGGEYTMLFDITCVTGQFQFANLRG